MAKKKRTTGRKKSGRKTPGRTTARRSSGGAPVKEMSTEALEAELRRRRSDLGKLVRKRDRLTDQLKEVNEMIAQMGGPIGISEPGRKRPRNKRTLPEALADVPRGVDMSVTEAAEAVQLAGYRTTSPSFRTIVNQTLIRDKRFKKISRGRYTVK